MLRHPAPPNARATGAAGASRARGHGWARSVTGDGGGSGPGRRGPWWRRAAPGRCHRGCAVARVLTLAPEAPTRARKCGKAGGASLGAAPRVLRNTARVHGLADRDNAGSNFTYCPAVIGGYYHRGAVGEVGSCESAPPRAAPPRIFDAPPPPPRVPQRAYACLGGCQERPGAASHASPQRTEAHRSAPPLAPGRRNPTPHLPRARARDP